MSVEMRWDENGKKSREWKGIGFKICSCTQELHSHSIQQRRGRFVCSLDRNAVVRTGEEKGK